MITRYRPDTDEECRSFEMIEDKEGDYVAYEDYEDELAEARKEIAEQRILRDNLLITNKELNDTLDSYAIVCRGHSGTLSGIFNLRKRAETAEYLLSEREKEISELLYYVQNKYPGETRYETAKRFIKERQAVTDNTAKAALAGKEDGAVKKLEGELADLKAENERLKREAV